MRNKIVLLVVIAFTLVVGMLLMTQSQTQAQDPLMDPLVQADFAGYCQSVGHADAILWNESADGWVCVNADGLVWHVSQIYDGYNSVCVWKTGLLAAYAVNYTGESAFDWHCAYVEAAPNPGAPAPEAGPDGENSPITSATAVPEMAPPLSPESLPVVMDPPPPPTTAAQGIYHPEVAPLPSIAGFWHSLRNLAHGWW